MHGYGHRKRSPLAAYKNLGPRLALHWSHDDDGAAFSTRPDQTLGQSSFLHQFLLIPETRGPLQNTAAAGIGNPGLRMSAMPAPRKLKLRSRTGCVRCRRRRQKCDEVQPACTRCSEAGSDCAYETQATALQQAPAEAHQGQSASQSLTSTSGLSQKRLGNMGLLALLNPSRRSLLAFFIEDASFTIACHDSIQFDMCRALISAGSAFPCLLYATLAFGAMHRATLPSETSSSQSFLVQALDLRSAALSALQSELLRKDQSNHEITMATAMMLATCDLRFSPETGTWRQHFEYARSLTRSRNLRDGHESPLLRFIHRRYTMMEFLVSLPTSWSLQKPPPPVLPDKLPVVHDVGLIDGTMACVTDLLEVFRWIGTFEDARYWSTDGMPREQSSDGGTYATAEALVAIVHQMMERDSRDPPMLSRDLGENFTDSQVEGYRACNSMAQHIALICLNCYGLGMHSSSATVIGSVDSIIQLASSMPQHVGSHPYICLTTALFVAGSEALGENRSKIRDLLNTQYQVTRSRNTLRAQEMLDKIWRAPKAMRHCRPDALLEDFVPY